MKEDEVLKIANEVNGIKELSQKGIYQFLSQGGELLPDTIFTLECAGYSVKTYPDGENKVTHHISMK